MSRPLVVGIAGGTGSGKTTVAHKLETAIPDNRCVRIAHDAYYRDQPHLSPDERAAVNYDPPRSLESALFVQHLRRLRAGEPVDVPFYAFAHLTRRTVTRRNKPTPKNNNKNILVFVEAALREQMDIK